MRKLLAVLLGLGVAGCDDNTPSCSRDPTPIDPDGTSHGFVVSSINLPDEGDEQSSFALDIDQDLGEGDTPENQLGAVLFAIARNGQYDLDRETNLLIEAGAILHLLDVRATDLEDADGVGLRIAHGIDLDGDPADNFTGSESFGIDASRGEGLVTGSIHDRHLEARLGTAPIAVTLPGLDQPLIVPLIAARFDAWLTPDGELVGRFGGGIPVEYINTTLLPLFHEGLSRSIERDCPGGTCEPGSFGELLLELFDQDGDGTMTLEELRQDPLTEALLAPDMDLRDESRIYAPSCRDRDDVYDALSIGAGFRAVPATF